MARKLVSDPLFRVKSLIYYCIVQFCLSVMFESVAATTDNSSNVTCLGEILVFECQVAGNNGATVWHINGSECDRSEGGLILRHELYNSSTTRHCDTSSITARAQSLEYDGVYYISSLTVTIKPTYNKTTLNISCQYDSGTDVVLVDSYSIVIPCTNGTTDDDGGQKKGEIIQ